MRGLGVSRFTASKYLDSFAATGLLRKEKIGRSTYCINAALSEILTKDFGGCGENAFIFLRGMKYKESRCGSPAKALKKKKPHIAVELYL